MHRFISFLIHQKIFVSNSDQGKPDLNEKTSKGNHHETVFFLLPLLLRLIADHLSAIVSNGSSSFRSLLIIGCSFNRFRRHLPDLRLNSQLGGWTSYEIVRVGVFGESLVDTLQYLGREGALDSLLQLTEHVLWPAIQEPVRLVAQKFISVEQIVKVQVQFARLHLEIHVRGLKIQFAILTDGLSLELEAKN